MPLPEKFMVLDVESMGLHGRGFAVGWVVVDQAGTVLEEGKSACDPEMAMGHGESPEDREWVKVNVPVMECDQKTPYGVRQAFWKEWMKWKAQGAVLVADCAWPVEAKFLIACVDDDPESRRWEGPYPLFDLSSFLLMAGCDPLGTFPREPNELPAHDPLNDARQSVRVMQMAFKTKMPAL